MDLDVGIPMGWLFFTLSVVLVDYGLIADPAIYVKTLSGPKRKPALGFNLRIVWRGYLVVGAQKQPKRRQLRVIFNRAIRFIAQIDERNFNAPRQFRPPHHP